MKNHYPKTSTPSRYFPHLAKLFLAALFVCGTYTLQAQSPCATFGNNIAYVNGAATVGTNDGTSWATAFLTLEEGLAAARSCGVTQIWVTRGIYQPTDYPVGITTTGTLSSADYSFHLVDGVAIYGGFSGLGFETQLSQRNARLNKTILSGGGTAKHVVLSVNDGLATIIDGFTVMGGNANGSSTNVEGVGIAGGRGAGMFIIGSSITLNNLNFTGNQAFTGGGMYMGGGASALTNMVFIGNSSSSAGGAMETAQSTFTLINGVFSGNQSGRGGALFLTQGGQILRNVVFSQNSTPQSFSDGGAILNNASTLDLINCTFFGNSTGGTGGAMYNVNGCTIRDKNGIYFGNTAASFPDVRNFTSGADTFTPITTLFGNDPKFINPADPDGPDNIWMTADDGLALQSTSPAIDAGTAAGAPATDILGATRVGSTDQGAYERTPCTGFIAALTPANSTITCGNASVTLTASATGATSYTLTNGPTNATGQFAVTAQGLYTVTASNGSGCTSEASALVAEEPAPTAYALTGGGIYCSGGTGVAVGLANSQSGVNYQLKRDNGNVGSPVAGTDGPISFGNQTSAGNYTVTATNATTNCTADMTGSAVVAVNALPTATVSGGGVVCAGQPLPDVSVALTGAAPFNFTYTNGTTSTTVTGTTTNPYLIANAPAGTYSVTALSDDNGCAGTSLTGSATVTVNPLPTVNAGPDQSVILGFGGANSNCTDLTATPSGGSGGGYTFTWNPGSLGGQTINVCPEQTTTFTVTVKDGNMCTSVADEVTVNVQDVRCGNRQQNVTICYYGVTQCVSEKIARRYLRLGATLGGCGTGNARIGVEESSELPLTLSLKAYPNPVQDAVKVEVLSRVAGTATFEVLDVAGRVGQSRQQELVEGLNEVEFRLGTLPTGIYLIKAVDALGQQGVVRVSKQ